MTLSSEERPERGLPPRPPEPAEPPAELVVPDETAPPPESGHRLPYSRVRAAWVGVWAGVAAVILLIVFVAQNTAAIDVHFLWLDGRISTALALLIAGVGGAIVAMAVAAARIIQLRRALRTREVSE